MRQLTEREMSMLEERGCAAEEWSEILVDDDFIADAMDNVLFYGHVEIGSLCGTIEVEEGFRRRCRIRNATLRNVSVGDHCLIENVRGYISNYDIGARCYIADVGMISTQDTASFGNGNVISVLNEGGDGNVVVYDKLTAQIAQLMMMSEGVRQMVLDELSRRSTAERGQIGDGSRIVGVKEMSNVMAGTSCEIQGASRISSSTLLSSDDAPTFIGSDVIITNCVVAQGASVTDGAKADNCFIGESVHLGKGFSAESSLFFANSYMDNGEACAALCGPFSTSHHKSTLLIGGEYSFYNAGSGTNQSNHAYKMGPIHWGKLGRGAKTASGCHILWPAHIGAFSMAMGKITSHPDLSELPFSYVIASEEKTYVVPGINIRTAGTWRDINKWAKRDLRPLSAKRDIVNYDFPNPYVTQQAVKGKHLLSTLIEEQGEDAEEYTYGNCVIKRTSLLRGIKYYDLIIRLFVHGISTADMERADGNEEDTASATEWTELCGMPVLKEDIDRLVKDIESGAIANSEEALAVLEQIDADYITNRNAYAASLMRKENESGFVETEQWRSDADKAYSWWLKMVCDDAEKEFALGDVAPETLRQFIEGVEKKRQATSTLSSKEEETPSDTNSSPL